MSYEDIKTAPGMFWCRTHGIEMPLELRSADLKYCRDCYAVIKGERYSPEAPQAPSDVEESAAVPPGDESRQLRFVTAGNEPLSPTLEECIDKILRDPDRPPADKSSRKIAAELKAGGNFDVSYGTINRRINAMKETAHV